MSDEERRQKFQSVMAELSANYIAKLPGKADELQRSLEAVRAGEPDSWELMERLVHRLAGSAGSFGVHDVSQHANLLDGKLQKRPPLDTCESEVRALIELMYQRASQAAPE